MFSIISTISQWSLGLIDQFGYPGVFLLSVLDRVLFSFLPAEVILVLFGFLAGQGEFSFLGIFILAAIGHLIGDTIIYWVARFGGRSVLEKYGKYFLIKKHELDHTDELFQKHGGKIILIGRFIPLVRTFISIPAGVAKMNFKKFVLYSLIGALPWNFILMFAGLKTGENLEALELFLQNFDFAIIILLALVVIYYIYHHMKKRHATHE